MPTKPLAQPQRTQSAEEFYKATQRVLTCRIRGIQRTSPSGKSTRQRNPIIEVCSFALGMYDCRSLRP